MHVKFVMRWSTYPTTSQLGFSVDWTRPPRANWWTLPYHVRSPPRPPPCPVYLLRRLRSPMTPTPNRFLFCSTSTPLLFVGETFCFSLEANSIFLSISMHDSCRSTWSPSYYRHDLRSTEIFLIVTSTHNFILIKRTWDLKSLSIHNLLILISTIRIWSLILANMSAWSVSLLHEYCGRKGYSKRWSRSGYSFFLISATIPLSESTLKGKIIEKMGTKNVM